MQHHMSPPYSNKERFHFKIEMFHQRIVIDTESCQAWFDYNDLVIESVPKEGKFKLTLTISETRLGIKVNKSQFTLRKTQRSCKIL